MKPLCWTCSLLKSGFDQGPYGLLWSEVYNIFVTYGHLPKTRIG